MTLFKLKHSITRGKFFASLFLYLFVFSVSAQKTTIYIEPDREFKIGVELFDKKKVWSCYEKFSEYY